ncbi:MAG: hypothetical protein MJA29_07955, partial [Candidatus Omnitrophica bacterium]|nr:hypothetical protein [Candidatus Omnitrophota bacterium]
RMRMEVRERRKLANNTGNGKPKTRKLPWMSEEVQDAWQRKIAASKEYVSAKRNQEGQITIQDKKQKLSRKHHYTRMDSLQGTQHADSKDW